jgi:hypothetical protein
MNTWPDRAMTWLEFVATFKEFSPRSFPPSFVPTTIMEQTMDDLRDARRTTPGGGR